MIPLYKLEDLGFKKVQDRFFEKEFSYDWFRLKINDFELDCTIEYITGDIPSKQYFELDGKELKGLIRPFEIQQLKQML